MRIVYWPIDEYRCGRENPCVPDIWDDRSVHLHLQADHQVFMVYNHVIPEILRRSHEPPGGSLLGWPTGVRNICVIGPDGRVLREVLYSDDEIAERVASLL